MTLARWLDLPGRKNLDSLLNHYGLARTGKHNALADATDTAELLRRLLGDAATQGVRDLSLPHPTSGKDSEWRTTGDYGPANPDRGRRAGRRSPFTFIERPAAHATTHTPIPKAPTGSDLDVWWVNTLECVALRCPVLPTKVDELRVKQSEVADKFLAQWRAHMDEDDMVSANTCLGAAFILLAKTTPATDAEAWLATWEPHLSHTTRCLIPTDELTNPVDGCPDCRADRACSGDTWPSHVAKLLLGAGRNFSEQSTRPWRRRGGKLEAMTTHGQGVYAAPAAWFLFEMLTNTNPVLGQEVADLADDLGLIHPRLTVHQARRSELAGASRGALTRIEAALAVRGTSSDRGWMDLLDLRDAIGARDIARERREAAKARPHRDGHSAPETRPDRRRFTLDVDAPPVVNKTRNKAGRKRRSLA